MNINVKAEDLFNKAYEYQVITCGLNRNGKRFEKAKARCLEIWNENFTDENITVQIKEFCKEAIKEDSFYLKDKKIKTFLLTHIPNNILLGGYVYLFHAPQLKIEYNNMVDVLYADIWLTSIMDAIRYFLHNYLFSFKEKEYISEGFGPGFFGIDIDSVRYFLDFMNPEELNISINDAGVMLPQKSLVGAFFTMSKAFNMPTGDCSSCLSSGSGCEFCQDYKNSRINNMTRE